VNTIKKRHQAAVDILEKFGLDYVKLEPEGRSHYFVWRAWTPAIPLHNGHETVKRGRVKIRV
jgi:hypothetical protein